MKKVVIMLLSAITSNLSVYSDNIKNIKTKPEKVIVFTQGAQVFRNSEFVLNQGLNTLVFEGLESTVDQNSIQVTGKGNFIISQTQFSIQYPEIEKEKANGDQRFSKTMKIINDSIKLLNFQKQEISNQLEVLNLEKNILLNYRLFKGQSTKDSLPLLREGLSFFREKLNNIFAEILRKDQESAKVNMKLADLNQRLNMIYQDLGKQSGANPTQNTDYRIVVSLIAEQAGTVKMNLNYFVQGASWTPLYDLRTEGVETNVKLTYKGLLQQYTGVDWKDVKLVLSTGNPNQSISLPELNAWYLDYHYPHYKKKVYTRSKENNEGRYFSESPSMAADSNVLLEEKDAASSYDYVQFTDHTVQAEFEINLPYTIPSDNKKHIVSIMNKELPTSYIYKAVPKIDPSAFLTAQVTGWDELNLLPGNASIFFEGYYVGETFIQAQEAEDTLVLSMGKDQSIQLKRTKLKDKFKDKIIDNTKLYQFGYEIVIRNGNAKSIEIEIQDQIPLSRDKSIVVERQEVSNASYDETKGLLSWKVVIKSKDSKKLNFSYSVKAPKDHPIAIR